MKLLRQVTALALCLLMLTSGAVFAFSLAEGIPCAECGFTVGHAATCSLYQDIDAPDEQDVPDTEAPIVIPADEHACTCGDDADENLAMHDDTCPRKQYVRSLIAEKSADDIYAAWSSYDDALHTDILNILEEYYFTTYDALIGLLSAIPSEDNTGLAIDVGGIPSGIAMHAQTLDKASYHTELADAIGRHRLLFAVDISFSDITNAIYQPDGSVTVTLDVSQLELDGADTIGILHEHDGVLTKLGEYTVTDGKITFTTDSFSNFYGFVVDFEYNGSKYTMPGGSGIFLSELFDKLGILADVEDVTNVTFSDESLIDVTKRLAFDPNVIREEWYLKSLESFDTEETFTIEFDNQDPITIYVYDDITSIVPWADGTVQTYTNGETIGAVGTRIHIQGTVTLNLSGSVVLGSQFYVPTGSTLNILSTGDETEVFRAARMNDDMFVVEGGTLNIRPADGNDDGRIVFDGQYDLTVSDAGAASRKTSTEKVLTVNSGDPNNYATVILVQGGNLQLNHIDFKNFYTTDNVSGYQRSAVIESWAIDNTARLDGNYALLNIDDCTFSKCATRSDMSVVMAVDCQVAMTNCKFTDCYAGSNIDSATTGNKYGGVIKGNGGYYCQLQMTGCEMSNCYSSGWGGGILWAASGKAGDLPSKAIIDKCSFSNNSARFVGGAVSIEADMTVSNSTFTGNKAVAGGAISVFPFTLVDSTSIGVTNACGLTMGIGNTISGNTATGTGAFTAYGVTYESGGGGIWTCLNINGWDATLDIGKGNTISNNTSNNKGGGIFVTTTANMNTSHLNIGDTDGGPDIIGNKAFKGGGIAVMNSTLNITNGNINLNTASNGGGIHISNNGVLNVTGGIIKENTAQGSFSGTTAISASEGVGGGIYIDSGSFSMSGENVGIHSNTAAVAANDAYASGANTRLTLPAVSGMNLAGWTGTGQARGWYADYMPSDTNYPQSVMNADNPGRYDYLDENKLNVDAVLTNTANAGTYYCLTLGTPYLGFGDITITKVLEEKAPETQTFLFNITGDNSYSLTVAIVIEEGEKTASITVLDLPDGNYTVTELSDWSWRYQLTSVAYTANDKTVSSGVTIGDGTSRWIVTFTNKCDKDKWLSHDCYCENMWNGDENSVTRRDETN